MHTVAKQNISYNRERRIMYVTHLKQLKTTHTILSWIVNNNFHNVLKRIQKHDRCTNYLGYTENKFRLLNFKRAPTPMQTDLGRFTARTFHPRMIHPPECSPPDCSPPVLFTPRIFTPWIVHPPGKFSPRKIPHLSCKFEHFWKKN